MLSKSGTTTIRPISINDIEGFHTCLDAVSRERKYLGSIEAPPLENTRKWLKNGIEQGEIRMIALDDASVVGWCDIEVPEREGFCHIGRLGMGILKDFRGQGLGRVLLEKTLAIAKEQNLERIELEVYASNVSAIGLYKTFGFQLEGQKRKARKLDGSYDDIMVMALLFDSSSTI